MSFRGQRMTSNVLLYRGGRFWPIQNTAFKLDIVIHAYHSQHLEAETGDYLQVGSQLGLHSYFMPTRVPWGRSCLNKIKNRKPGIWKTEAGGRVQVHSQLNGEFKSSQWYIRPCLKDKDKTKQNLHSFKSEKELKLSELRGHYEGTLNNEIVLVCSQVLKTIM